MLKKALRGAAIVAPALIIDRLTKLWTASGVPPRELIPGVVGVRYAENTGAAFSFLSGAPWVVGVISITLTILLTAVLLIDREMPKAARFGLWLVVAGGLGNLYDRFAYGYVIDFIELLFIRFAIFNVADICVCCGAALACISILISDSAQKKRVKGETNG